MPVIIIHYLLCTLELQWATASTHAPIWSARQRGEGKEGKQILFEIIQGDSAWTLLSIEPHVIYSL